MIRPEPGQRIRVVGVMDDPDPLPVGTVGTVQHVANERTQYEQVWVDWDSGRTLMLVPPDYPVMEVVR